MFYLETNLWNESLTFYIIRHILIEVVKNNSSNLTKKADYPFDSNTGNIPNA